MPNKNQKYTIAAVIFIIILVYIYKNKYFVVPSKQPTVDDSQQIPVSKYINGRYIRLSNSTGGVLNISEIMVFNTPADTVATQQGKDIAQGAPVVASSTFEGFVASSITDNNIQNFAHTQREAKPMFTIDLGTNQQIGEIIVFNRIDCCKGRISGAVLTIYDDNMIPVWTSDQFKGPDNTTISSEDNNGYAIYDVKPSTTSTSVLRLE